MRAKKGPGHGGQGLILFIALLCVLSGFIIAGVFVWRVAATEPLPQRTASAQG